MLTAVQHFQEKEEKDGTAPSIKELVVKEDIDILPYIGFEEVSLQEAD